MTSGAPIIALRDVNVWFSAEDKTVQPVQGVSLELRPGECFGLAGESGCGKTTVLLSMMGLLPRNATVSGEVLIQGEDIFGGFGDSARPYRWRTVAMVFQGAMNALNPVRRVLSQIVEPMEVWGTARGAAARSRALDLLALVGLSAETASLYPHEMSGGMRQRAAIAMSLACEPKVLLADEPTTALDVMVQAQILEILRNLSVELGLSLVLVTHDLPLIAEICDRTAVMYGGRVVEEGPVDELLSTPGHPYTRMLFASVPKLTSTADELRSIPGSPPRPDETTKGCSFAPRCDCRVDVCDEETPELCQVAPGHTVACSVACSDRVPGSEVRSQR